MHGFFAALAIICCALSARAQSTPPLSVAPEDDQTKDNLMPLDVLINNTKGGVWTLLERNAKLYAPQEAFEEWRLIHAANPQGIDYKGQKWFALSDIPGFEARLNYAEQSVNLVFSPTAFNATRLTQEVASRPPITESIPALFANYDLNYSTARSKNFGSAAVTRDLGALTELGASGQWGLLTSSYVARNLVSQDPALSASWRRLETTYTRNFLDKTSTLRLGDSATRAGISGRSVYFGGVQFSRNFFLQPGFITQPVPIVSGLSAGSSTMELYINNALRQTSQVPAGPFSIDNFPSLTGSGEARVVIRDILGRETVITQSFFSHANLLEEKLNDWSFELGALRQNLGTNNADYGPKFISGLWRRGLTKSLTVEGQGEWSAALQRTGLGATYTLPLQMLGQTAVSLSRSNLAGSGYNWLVSAERSSLRHNFSASAQSASRGYRQLGLDTATSLPRLQTSTSYSYNSEELGSLGVGYTGFSNYDLGKLNTVNLSYSVRIGQRSSLTLTASKLSGISSGYSVGAALLLPFDNKIAISSGVSSRSGATESYVNASRALSDETGWGWRAALSKRASGAYSEGGAHYQGAKGQFSADLSGDQNQQNMRLGLTGGAVIADGKFFISRRVQDSFAIVEVPGYANVGVGFQGSSLTRTDANGVALLPRLLPFQRNSVRLDPSELPISAELDSIEQEAVPAQRSAAQSRFAFPYAQVAAL
ncbi:fimbria/pilus outer membrane usher protein [Polaromonas vacuolata]|nr:fimbria/pilus outer membrane usher protein [Polaromonas vacuolata]